ncbi:MAG: polyhydroxyalkanoic acid system family protein [bacterium]|nr:polyhydroxyalkanoic acid system family protein [bacterium]
MPNISLTIPHHLSRAKALSRIKSRLTKLKSENREHIREVKEEWNGHIGKFSFLALGMNFCGKIIVEDNQVLIEGEIPLVAMFYKPDIEKKIRAEAEKLLTAEKMNDCC